MLAVQRKAARRHAHDLVGGDRLGGEGHLLRFHSEVDLLEGEGILERKILRCSGNGVINMD